MFILNFESQFEAQSMLYFWGGSSKTTWVMPEDKQEACVATVMSSWSLL
jgi:hypothetical protein